MMTKKHYEAIAEQIQCTIIGFRSVHNLGQLDTEATDHSIAGCVMVANNISDYFAADNPKFDRERFLAACGVSHD